MGLMDSLKGSLKEAAGDVYEYIDDKVDMPVIIGAFYPLRVTTHDMMFYGLGTSRPMCILYFDDDKVAD